MKLLIKFASRSRPKKFFACLDNIISTIGIDDYLILCSLDVDDRTMATKEVYDRIKGYGEKVKAIYGFSNSKINAINRDISLIQNFDIILNHSDDMVCTIGNWGNEVISDFNNFSGLLHYPDGHANEALCTYSIMDKKYFDRFGYIYHPDYINNYCDNHAQDVAKRLNSYKFINKNIIRHENPIWGYGEKDELFVQQQNSINYAQDLATYQRFLNNNFELK